MNSELRCRYTSKQCNNVRCLKNNGQLHNLCGIHRLKANENQRRVDRKRKVALASHAEISLSDLDWEGAHTWKRPRPEQLPHVFSCLYRSQRCSNPRALKSNGTLHNLCQYHREIANETQRRAEERKRATQRAATSTLIEPMIAVTVATSVNTATLSASAHLSDESNDVTKDNAPLMDFPLSNANVLQGEDIWLLQALLFQ